MVDDQPFTDEAEQLNEQLSAYIDGELSPEENLRLEKQLATDEKIRDQLEVLKRNWGVLEVLPRENVSSRFTASTVEMVAIRAAENPTIGEPNTPGWVRLRPRWLIILTAAFLSGAVGYVASSTITKISPISGLLENENTFLLKHLNFLEHFTEYQLTENIEFLKQLNEIEYFSSRTKVAADPGIVQRKSASGEESRTRIHRMDLGERNRIHKNYLGFQALPKEEQEQLLLLHSDLLSLQNAEILSKVLITYSRWYQQLNPSQQVEITLRTDDNKIAYIQNILTTPPLNEKFFSEKDLIVIHHWLEDVALRNEKKILRGVDKNRKETIAQLNDRDKTRQLVILLMRILNKNQRLLATSNERKQYQQMKSRLSGSCRRKLSNELTVNDEIDLLVNTIRRAYRNDSLRASEMNKRE